jgi:hypothetical protein
VYQLPLMPKDVDEEEAMRASQEQPLLPPPQAPMCYVAVFMPLGQSEEEVLWEVMDASRMLSPPPLAPWDQWPAPPPLASRDQWPAPPPRAYPLSSSDPICPGTQQPPAVPPFPPPLLVQHLTVPGPNCPWTTPEIMDLTKDDGGSH